ncbi:Gfo/Idh/MocA family protein [Mucisphaera calidilacus]|uniref:1,5-anhydro-D-fructose reductase n=1 Tax=Mucisphaera calidilacus TaxID=2527982 RepID=A0A518BX62_9BACT|nr:Gfo/Idh/MocA family oxidoreductase [Mucisphaera calidilacus]QDU71561.1 1,5-anhydro-D-fructose reductase [Mucisphaera calidilacus]
MARSSDLGVALLGSKFMGKAHSNAYLNVAKFFSLPLNPRMLIAAARDPKDLRAFAKRWGWERTTTDWREAVADPEVGLVDVSTPNHLHADQSIAALEAGKHVACEKPLAGTLDDARVMLEAARKARKCKTFVWFNYRRVPAVAFARHLVERGKLGRIYHVRCVYKQDWGGPETPLLWRFRGKDAGSGALGDLGAHIIDASRFITCDEITEVTGAMMETFIKERAIVDDVASKAASLKGGGKRKRKPKMGRSTVDDACVFTARFKGGAIATFEATRLSTGDKNGNRIEIHGEKGAVRFGFNRMNELEWYDNTLEAGLQGWSTIDVTDGSAGHPYVGNWWPVGHGLGYEHGFVNQLADTCRAIAGKKVSAPIPDFADAYMTQRVMEAVVLSAKHRSAVKLSEVK